MKAVRIKALSTKPAVKIDPNWFPYRDIVSKKEYGKICSLIENQIALLGEKNVKVYYEVLDWDENNNPLKIHIMSKMKVGFLRETESSYFLLAQR